MKGLPKATTTSFFSGRLRRPRRSKTLTTREFLQSRAGHQAERVVVGNVWRPGSNLSTTRWRAPTRRRVDELFILEVPATFNSIFLALPAAAARSRGVGAGSLGRYRPRGRASVSPRPGRAGRVRIPGMRARKTRGQACCGDADLR